MISKYKDKIIVSPPSSEGSSMASPVSKKEYKNLKKEFDENSWKYTDDEIRIMMLLMTRYKDNKCMVYWEKSKGLEQLAHELGHVDNYWGKSIERFIHKGAKFGNTIKREEDKNGVTYALLSVLGSKFINWEEKNASKKGYELLKQHGLSQNELRIAKENLDNAIKIYKSQSKQSWRRKLIDSKIPQWLL